MNIRPILVLLAVGWPVVASAQTVTTIPTADTSAAKLGFGPIDVSTPTLPTAPLQLRVQSNRPLRLEDAIAIALERSPQLKIAHLSVDRAEAVLAQAQAALFPTVSFSANYTYQQTPQQAIQRALVFGQNSSTGGTGGGGDSGGLSQVFLTETASVSGNANINWTIFSSGLVGSRILAAQESVNSARLDFERIRQDLINGVIGAYYDLQTADGNVEIGEAAVRSAEANLRDARAQEQAGVGTRFNVLQADVQLANAQQQLLQAQNQRTINQRNLARILNFEAPTDISAADTVERGSDWNLGLEETILRAYRGRVELNQQLAIERAAKAQEAVAYATTAPQVSVFLQGQAFDNLLDQVTGIYTGYSTGVQVSWTAFDGGAARAQADQAIADARTARFRYIDTLNSVRFSVENSLSTLNTANQRIAAANAGLASAEESLRLARLRFQAGVGTQLEVINADRDLTQARVNRLIAVIDYNRALAAIRRSTGSL